MVIKLPALPTLYDKDRVRHMLHSSVSSSVEGTVWSVGRNAMEAICLPVPMGAICEVRSRGFRKITAEVIGFEGTKTLLAPLDGSEGISPGDQVVLVDSLATVGVGPELLGRVIDAAGRVIDDAPAPPSVAKLPLDAEPVLALHRPTIDSILTTGVRTIDSVLTLGRGQRIGIFAGSGVGKSTLLGMMARGTDADVVVIALVGERGREVQEYLQRELDPKARKKCVTVVATSDQPALRRVQAALTATSIAEYFRDTGKNVLLMMDSVTRFAMAQREIGLAAGEAPTTRGYPPSVFSMLPRLVERSGTSPTGSITGIYTVLVEGDDTNEPISDTLRGLLDGHFVLSRNIAHRGRYPAIDVLASLSRLQHHLVDSDHRACVQSIRNVLATYKENEDLITIGAYARGSNPDVDRAIQFRPQVEAFLAQSADQIVPWKQSLKELLSLAKSIQQSSPSANSVQRVTPSAGPSQPASP
ncbi:MAG: FliI/YscN family ATPase [Planctomycetales bacterium]|nr:FliI/YscN family ATPase [Planctomycetales bacterium]